MRVVLTFELEADDRQVAALPGIPGVYAGDDCFDPPEDGLTVAVERAAESLTDAVIALLPSIGIDFCTVSVSMTKSFDGDGSPL